MFRVRLAWDDEKAIGDLIDAPVPQAKARIARQVRRNPIVESSTVQFLLGFVGAEKILGCVTAAAMTEAGNQIGAAVPLR